MNIDIRKNIIDNFKDSNIEEIKESIDDAIKENEEITLPGLGVIFEILWKNINNNQKEEIVKNVYEGIKKYD